MPPYTALLSTITNSVLTITLNRPESYNALNEAMKKELNDAFSKRRKGQFNSVHAWNNRFAVLNTSLLVAFLLLFKYFCAVLELRDKK